MLEPAIGRSADYTRRGANSSARKAEIVRVDASLDARTRLSNLYLVPEAVNELRIGDFVDVSIRSDAVQGAMKLPATALSGQSEVWVVEGEQLVGRTVRVLGEEPDQGLVIVAPFDPGDGIVALPPLEAEAGQAVTVRARPERTATTGGPADAAQ